MIRIFVFVFAICIRLSNSLEGYYQPPRGSSVWGYFTPPLLYRVPTRTHQTAMDAMVDLTNNLGVTILKDHSYSKGNFAFSPYGVASVLVVLYEGACGESASQIHRAIGFPFDKDVIRVGFRSIHRHLRSYFSHEGYLSGISLNKEGSALKPEFKRILKFYGYDVDVNHPVDEDISLEDLASPATPSGGTIANSNVTSPSPNEVTEDDEQSMNNADKTEESDGNEDKPNDVSAEAGDKSTEKPESTTSDGTDPWEEGNEKPDEAGDDQVEEKETENPGKTPDDVSTEGNEEKPVETSGVDSTESGKETPEKTTEDANDSSATEKPTTTDKNENDKQVIDSSDKTSTENGDGAVEEDKENSDMTTEDGSSSNVTETEQTDDTADDKEDKKDKQNPEEAANSSEEPNKATDDQDDNKETENQDKTPEDDNASQEDKENSDSATEDHSQLNEQENEKVCVGKEDCENKTEDSTSSTTAKQEPEETSITTLSDGLVLNKTEPTEEVEDLQVTSSTIKNSDENSENSEAGVPTTPEKESEDSVSQNLESPLTSTQTPLQEEKEVTKVTENSDTEMTTIKPNLDNGMLIPQPDDLPTDSKSSTTEAEGNNESTTPETIAESKTDMTEDKATAEVTTTKPHSRRKRSSPVEGKLPPSNRLRSMNKISIWGQMKLAGVESTRQTRQAFHPKLSASYRMRKERTITDYLKWPPASDVSLQLQNGMFDSHVSRNLELYKSLPRLLFLVDGAIDTPVPMMSYTHVFPYAYIPRLHTKVLEFPLDDVRYKLLILLPVERRGLRQLIYDLTEFPLREVFTSLEPTKVRAMIPPFMVEGFVILTSSLQKLGIWDVFDPRKSNLSGMSIDPELYVRNVEQSVTVVIRNYVEILDIQTRTMAARNIEHDFEATHPFLYFVLDTATNVALMAGQILDPLNSRIY